ncbi:hypothetical protein [Microvirga sp. VF16]|uniref:hypothetical protein n=1 Tax=Microvirga sp. VF16 TaxID=2807101 RepID=UPI00193DCFF7|nr:hypothetical protein [Microvirga sp. VF16]QRM32330.1 hypothetical protein JO965_29850 [Microvirga sp. VF16]
MNPIDAEYGGSTGKRLRCFLQKVDDTTAVRTLLAQNRETSGFAGEACHLAHPSVCDLGKVINRSGRHLVRILHIVPKIDRYLHQITSDCRKRKRPFH